MLAADFTDFRLYSFLVQCIFLFLLYYFMNIFNMVLCFHMLGLMREKCSDLGTDPMLECCKLCVCSLLETDSYSSENDLARFCVGKSRLHQECKHLLSLVCNIF
jgi:hypothetical protein